jgi:hypothetical protein
MTSADEHLRHKDRRWYGEQDENGVDLSLIRENLRLTPEERLIKHEKARRAILDLQRNARRKWLSLHSINQQRK